MWGECERAVFIKNIKNFISVLYITKNEKIIHTQNESRLPCTYKMVNKYNIFDAQRETNHAAVNLLNIKNNNLNFCRFQGYLFCQKHTKLDKC